MLACKINLNLLNCLIQNKTINFIYLSIYLFFRDYTAKVTIFGLSEYIPAPSYHAFTFPSGKDLPVLMEGRHDTKASVL